MKLTAETGFSIDAFIKALNFAKTKGGTHMQVARNPREELEVWWGEGEYVTISKNTTTGSYKVVVTFREEIK